MFFIGQNGTPLEVVTGITKTVEELESKINAVLETTTVQPSAPSTSHPTAAAEAAGPSTSPAPTQASSSDPSADGDFEVVCEGGVCFKRPKQPQAASGDATNAAAATESAEQALANEAKLRRAKELIEKKRIEKEEENARVSRCRILWKIEIQTFYFQLEKERELNRRRAGQDLQNFKQRQEENEMKKQQEERRREKAADQVARQRILAQIAQDKADRAARLNNEAPPKAETKKEDSPPIVASSVDKSEARIQFKKPDGESDIKVFKSSEKFSVIRAYVEQNIIAGTGIRAFSLATTFPRKEFKTDDHGKTLLELNLAPTSVLLILPLDKLAKKSLPLQTGGGIFNAVQAFFWSFLNTFFATLTWGKSFILGKYNSLRGIDSGAQKRQGENELTPNDA